MPDNRRRKSDEMEALGNGLYKGEAIAAPPIRHGHSHGHARTGSLAHAHSLRSTRVLSQHGPAPGYSFPAASAGTNLAQLSASTDTPSSFSHSHSLARPHAPLSFGNPFNQYSNGSPAPSSWSKASGAPPPSKKMSVEGGAAYADRGYDDEDDDEGQSAESSSEAREDDSVFGMGGLIPARRARGGSFTRPTPPLFGGLPLPTSSSQSSYELSPAASRPRSRATQHSNSSNGLDTLAELGPAHDTFSPDRRERGASEMAMGSPSWEGVATPPRRRSEGPIPGRSLNLPPTPPTFSLFGSNLVSTSAGSTAFRRPKSSNLGEGSLLRPSLSEDGLDGDRRGVSMPDMSMVLDSPLKPSSSDHHISRLRPVQTRLESNSSCGSATTTATLTSSRRVASLDSLQLEPAPLAGRKRSATGAVVGPTNPTGLLPRAASGLPAPWHARGKNSGGSDLTSDDDAMDEDHLGSSWGPPGLTDGTTSASSSLSTALSSHAEERVPGSISNASLCTSTSSNGLPIAHGAGEPFYTPQNYKNVKPLAAAFMSTGLVSKRGSAVANRRDSGIGLGFTPAAGNLLSQLQAQQEEAKAANLAAAQATGDSALDVAQAGAPGAAPVVLKNPLLAAVARAAVMPDTPVKRSFGSGVNPTSGLAISSAIMDDDDDDDEDDDESAQLRTAPGSASSNATATSVGSPGMGPSLLVAGSVSRRSTGSPNSMSGVSPTAHAMRSSAARSNMLTAPVMGSGGRAAKSRQMFRRRSSGQVEFGANGVFRSGSSSGSSSFAVEPEPMTPTRSVAGRWWEGTQLTDTPLLTVEGETPPLTPAMGSFPGQSGLHPINPALASMSTPHGQVRTSFPLSAFERAVRFAPPVSSRPVLKARHSSATGPAELPMVPQNGWFEDNFVLIRCLGEGAFSDAFEVQDRKRKDQVFAVKRTKQPFGGPKDRLRRLEEVDILRYFSTSPNQSPHLISLVDAWEQNGHLFIQTELCAAGNLSDFLYAFGQEHDMLDETRLWKILTETASGLAHLHAHNVLHLDIKPANIFVDGTGHLKLGDFGLATRWPRADPLSVLRGAAVNSPGGANDPHAWRQQDGERRVRAKSNGDAPEDLEREGDREYIAPEILRGQYGKEADLFSLGLVLIEAAANVVLPDNNEPWRKLRNDDFSDVAVPLGRLSPTLVTLVTSILNRTAELRPSIEGVMRHPVVARLSELLGQGLEIERAHKQGARLEEVPPVLGALQPEAESFLNDLFDCVERQAQEGPAAEVDAMDMSE